MDERERGREIEREREVQRETGREIEIEKGVESECYKAKTY